MLLCLLCILVVPMLSAFTVPLRHRPLTILHSTFSSIPLSPYQQQLLKRSKTPPPTSSEPSAVIPYTLAAPLPSPPPSTTSLEATSQPQSSPPPPPKVSKTALKDALKTYRLRQIADTAKPAYTVLTNAAIDGITVSLPDSLDELLYVKGIGPKKVEMYGEDILDIIRGFTHPDGYVSGGPRAPTPPVPEREVIDKATLTGEQLAAVERIMASEDAILITGSAGTGKSHILKFLVQTLTRNRSSIPGASSFGVAAPTGVAAVAVGGSTLHAYFGIGLGTGSHANIIKKVKKVTETVRRIDETGTLIIDEVSMLSVQLLETLDEVCRSVRKEGTLSHLPFGGIRLVCFGDFYQLPPVSRERGAYRPFCFDSEIWMELGLSKNVVVLEEVVRQENSEFITLLNDLRTGRIEEGAIRKLNGQCFISESHPLPVDGIVPTKLYCVNADVDSENVSRLEELEGEMRTSVAMDVWRQRLPAGTVASVKKKMIDSLEKEVLKEIRLKVGAQVMLTRNLNLEKNLVNGSRGVIIKIDTGADGGITPWVRFDCGITMPITAVESLRYNPVGGEEGVLARMQLPLKLAWAMTIHKSQGCTLSRALLDVSSAFEFGQVYVALSRVKSLEGLWLEREVRLGGIRVSPQVVGFFKGLERDSVVLEEGGGRREEEEEEEATVELKLPPGFREDPGGNGVLPF